ncbi:6-pyruvoyl trahydropterin synthase family protein [Brevibacterium luteolum]|uniref:6-pyruvoyl trahydropterin synthase family protein n=1 Tax=Brevibacterium luteolum TaxID=199591 RepID=UPI003EEA10B0
MFRLSINDHIMIAHSLPDPFFGPAQHMHGATLAVEAHFETAELDSRGVVLDIGRAGEILSTALDPLRYANLDEHPDFAGKISTTEVIAAHIGNRLREALADRPDISIAVTLDENPNARVTYTVPPAPTLHPADPGPRQV